MSTIDAARNFGYAMAKSGPVVNPRDVESEQAAIEVAILWGDNALQVVHLLPSRSFCIGDDSDPDSTHCDYVMPAALLGATRAPLVVSRGFQQRLVVWPRARGHVEIPGEGPIDLAVLITLGRAEPSEAMHGAYEYELPPDAKARIALDGSDIAFQVSAINAGKRLPAAWLKTDEPAGFLYTGLSFVLHAGVIASLALLMPHMSSDDGEALDADRILMMQKLLDASADREQAARQAQDLLSDSTTPRGGSGAASNGPAGAMGAPKAPAVAHRYAVAGPEQNPDPHLAKRIALEQAATFGTIGVLATMLPSDPNAPTARWGRDDSMGKDAASALGNLFGDTTGQALGTGGLGLSGAEEGGGGYADSIGLHDFGTGLEHGGGPGLDQGTGAGKGAPNRGHIVRTIGVRESMPTVNGRIPRDVIQRVVHQNFGRFRLCYQNGLRGNPTLAGRVVVKFTIDRTGAVAMSVDGGSDLADAGVVQCVVRGFANLSFPPPGDGMVTVSYPVLLSPE